MLLAYGDLATHISVNLSQLVFTPLLAGFMAVFFMIVAVPVTMLVGVPLLLALDTWRVFGAVRLGACALVGAVVAPVAWYLVAGDKPGLGLDVTTAIVFGICCGLLCGWRTRQEPLLGPQ